MQRLTEAQWFDLYYPSELGDWTKEFNLDHYPEKTGCCWFNYQLCGEIDWSAFVSDNPGNLLLVQERQEPNCIDHFFVKVSPNLQITPYYQPLTNDYWVSVIVDLHGIDGFNAVISGTEEEFSFIKTYKDLDSLTEEIAQIFASLFDGDLVKQYNYINY
jgi:hypothetical protein